MTACVNKHTKRVAAVVTASLVGALSLGVAPVAAMAQGDISLLGTDESNVVKATPEYESAQTTFYANGKGQGRVPSKVIDDAGIEHKVYLRDDSALVDGEFYYYYVQIDDNTGTVVTANGMDVQRYEDGKLVDLKGTSVKTDGAYSMPSDEGDYAVVIAQWKGGSWYLRGIADTFSIVGFSLDDAVLIDGKDVSDSTFNYTGEAGSLAYNEWVDRLGVAVGNHVLAEGDDYTITIKEKNSGVTPTDLDLGVIYVATITGQNNYEGTKSFDFTIGKLDLSNAVVVGRTETFAPGPNATFSDLVYSINGVSAFGATGMADGQFDVNLKDEGAYSGNQGETTYTITAKADSKYVTGSAEVTYTYADVIADIDFTGCGTWDSSEDAFVVDQSSENPTLFDLSHIKVMADFDGDRSNETNIRDKAEVTVYDADHNVVDMAGKTQITDFGTYYVEVTVSYKDETTGKYVANSRAAKVVVMYDGVTTANDVYMTYKGQNVVSAASDTYDGTDLSQNMKFTVKAGDKTLVQGTDYTVTFEKQADDGARTEVEAITDGGVYIITVEGLTYDGKAEFTFIVDAAKPEHIVVDHDLVTGKDAHGCPAGIVSYTGEAIEATFSFYGSKGAELEGVPADAYVVDSYDLVEYNKTTDAWEVVERDVELKDKGFYQAHIKTADGVVNYDLDGVSELFEVTDDKVFNDVSNDFWAAEDIYTANKNGWMNGYGYTDFFGPNDNIKRGDVAVVLYKMAGQPEFVDEGQYDETTGFKTGFGDVDGKMYYAEAILWAKQAGIVSGDEGTGMFRPEDSISRQELAKMLTVYAEKCNEDVSSDVDAVLGEYEDANTVSEWAKGYVAYLVEAGVMGNESPLRATDPITRAEVATMVVRLSDTVDFDNVIFK